MHCKRMLSREENYYAAIAQHYHYRYSSSNYQPVLRCIGYFLTAVDDRNRTGLFSRFKRAFYIPQGVGGHRISHQLVWNRGDLRPLEIETMGLDWLIDVSRIMSGQQWVGDRRRSRNYPQCLPLGHYLRSPLHSAMHAQRTGSHRSER